MVDGFVSPRGGILRRGQGSGARSGQPPTQLRARVVAGRRM